LRWRSAAAIALALMPVAAARAQALACVVPDRIPVPRLEKNPRDEPVRTPPITGYKLAMSWSPQYCANARDPLGANDRFQCSGDAARFGWVLHGLWPETDTPAYPQWCRPARIVPQQVLRQHICQTPTPQLLQHEWAKHGTCMSPHPAAYFKAASMLFRAVRFPDMAALATKPQTAGGIRRAFAAVNPGVKESMIAVATDRKGWLSEVRLCLGPRMRPQACKSFQKGLPDRSPVRVRSIPRR